MDESISRIAEYAHAWQHERLPQNAVEQCKLRVVDTFGCGLGAYADEPCRAARKLALRVSDPAGAVVLGTAHRTLPELAAFAGGVMTRYLDGNDTYPGGGGHPSDVIAPVLAVADATRANGKAAIGAIALAYEVYRHFVRAVCMRDRGMDHVLYTAAATAVGAAKLLGLDLSRMAEAVSLAVTPNIALHATRRGDLSMWKGCAAANGSRNGVFAALLAAEGVTGPANAIDGSHGLRELAGRFDITPFGGDGEPYAITDSNLKCFLSEYHSQSPITLALKLSRQVPCAEIEAVNIHTYWFAWSEIGSEPEKWHPTTRESADHSLPFIIAATLIDGAFSDRIFSVERIADRAVHRLADRIAVHEDKEFSRMFPHSIPCRMEIVTKDGRRVSETIEFPRGHIKNPLTRQDVATKFESLAGRMLKPAQVVTALDALWRLDEAVNMDRLFKAVAVDG